MAFDWNKYTTLNQASNQLVNNNFMADIQFKFADNTILYGHSMELIKRSPEFYKALHTSVGNMKIIYILDILPDLFLEFLRYCYTDKCKLNKTNANDMLKLAKKYSVEALVRACCAIIHDTIKVDSVCEILQSSIEDQYDTITANALKFIRNNFADVLKHESFFKINKNCVVKILELNPITPCSEIDIFNALMKWALHLSLKTGMSVNSVIGDAKNLIRFPTMTADEFGKCASEAEVHNILAPSEVSSIFLNITAKQKNPFGYLDVKRQFIIKVNETQKKDKTSNSSNLIDLSSPSISGGAKSKNDGGKSRNKRDRSRSKKGNDAKSNLHSFNPILSNSNPSLSNLNNKFENLSLNKAQLQQEYNRLQQELLSMQNNQQINMHTSQPMNTTQQQNQIPSLLKLPYQNSSNRQETKKICHVLINRSNKTTVGLPTSMEFAIKFSVSSEIELTGMSVLCPAGLIRYGIGVSNSKPSLQKEDVCEEGSFRITFANGLKLRANVIYDIAYTFITVGIYNVSGFATGPKVPITIKGDKNVDFKFLLLSQNIEQIIYRA